MNDIKVFWKRLHSNAVIPKYAKLGDAACDLHAVEYYTIESQCIKIFPELKIKSENKNKNKSMEKNK